MTLSQQEYDAIISDSTKYIAGDTTWKGTSNPTAKKFRINIYSHIYSHNEHPIFVESWYNSWAGKLSYSIIHKRAGRIYGLDLGRDHINPDGKHIGEKHKHYWVPGSQSEHACVPGGITATWDRPVEVWHQFCAKVQLKHHGIMYSP